MLDAARVHEEARLRRAPHSAACADRLLRDAGHLGGAPRRPLLHVLGDRFEADRVLLDEVVIEPVVLDHQVQDAVEERDVAARLDRQEEVAGARDRRDARIDDDDLRAVLARLPDVVRRDRRALGDVRRRRSSTTSALRMSSHGLAARSMPNAFLFAAPALTMQSRPL